MVRIAVATKCAHAILFAHAKQSALVWDTLPAAAAAIAVVTKYAHAFQSIDQRVTAMPFANSKWINRFRTVIRGCFVVAILCISSQVTAADKEREEKKENQQFEVAGTDPNGFSDAEQLFANKNQPIIPDSIAVILIETIDSIRIQYGIWSSGFWQRLLPLRGKRLSSTMLSKLQSMAEQVEINEEVLSSTETHPAQSAFYKGNKQYEADSLSEAIECYANCLKVNPSHWDAINNLALAEMHIGNDLLSLYFLTILKKNNPKYLGAAVNLTVCLERLGETSTAYDLACTTARENSSFPMASYNKAWLENTQCMYSDAEMSISTTLACVQEDSNARWLKTINMMETGDPVSDLDMQTLRSADRSLRIPDISIRYVPIQSLASSFARAYSGNSLEYKIPGNSKIIVSEQKDDWIAVYWPVNRVKRRLWTLQTESKETRAKKSTPKNTTKIQRIDRIEAPSSQMPKSAEVAVIDVAGYGRIVFGFFPNEAPNHVANFIKLAKSGFYNETTFHRIIPGFMIQGGDPSSKDGDPSNDGTGEPGYQIKAEFNKLEHLPGTVSMARASDPNSAGSQFFICHKAATHLNGQYTVFGQVLSGMDVVDKIANASRGSADNPYAKDCANRKKIVMNITIVLWNEIVPK